MQKLQKLLLLTVILTASMAMTACGIKPKSLDAPNEHIEDQFPRIYPTSPSQSK